MSMSIISGNFGSAGKASFDENGWIAIFGDKSAAYSPSDIEQSNAWQEVKRDYSILSVALGLVISIVLGVTFGILGALGGILLTVAGSKKNYKRNLVEIRFTDGNVVTIEGSRNETKRFFLTE